MIVVGGGIVGTMHALFALRRGLEVLHLERDRAPRSASVRNFGLIWVSGRAAGPELDAALRARELWEEIGRDVPGIGFRPNGSLTIALEPEECDALQDAARFTDADRRGFEFLEPDEIRKRAPAIEGKVLGGLYCSRDAAVEPRLAVHAIREYLIARPGYTFSPGTNVTEAGPGWVRDVGGKRHEADVVLVCPGAVDDLLGSEVLKDAPLRRCRLQMMETADLGADLPFALADGDSLRYYPAFREIAGRLAPPPQIVSDWGMQLLCVQRLHGGLTIGDTHSYEEPFDFALDPAPYIHLQERVERILGRRLPVINRKWHGVYSVPTDERIVFREEIDDGVWLVTGLGGRGMTLSPAVAEATIAEACGR
jgi:FAD dependent oxidoreductase TIGR03364